MHPGLNAVYDALNAARSPVRFFLRDDDAGWSDVQLLALLDCTARAEVPIDLAVIPQACGASLARELRARMDAVPGLLHVHQHGFAHVNHEPAGRKCEFGGARGTHQQRADLCAGRHRLQALFGERLDGLFTPPWNRCSVATPLLLAELGYAALSRDVTAPPQCGLPEVRVHVDWCRERRMAAQGGADFLTRVGAGLSRHIGTAPVVGIMLHHAQMDDADLALLGQLLDAVDRHPLARWAAMRELARGDSLVQRATLSSSPA